MCMCMCYMHVLSCDFAVAAPLVLYARLDVHARLTMTVLNGTS